MNYQNFIEDIRTQMALRLADKEQLRIESMLRNNGTTKVGLIIIQPDRNIAPTVYLEPYYNRYLAGDSLETICEEIYTICKKYMPKENFDTTTYTDFSKVAPRVVMRLINQRKNQELLQDIPHLPYMDMAIVFACLLEKEDDQNWASILIRNEHLQLWDASVDTLYTLALENSPKLLPLRVANIWDIVEPMIPNYSTKPNLYMITNEARHYGASIILYPGVLDELAKQFNSGFLLLPCSIHEWLIIPGDQSYRDYYAHMVDEVNRSDLPREELLSYQVLYYDKDEGKLL